MPEFRTAQQLARRRSLYCWLILSPFVLLTLFPFAVMLLTALKPADEVISYPARWLPSRLAWENFIEMWHETEFGLALWNSLSISLASTLLTLALAIPAAYALARLEFFGQASYRRFLLATQMLSPILLVLGLFRLAASIPYGNGNLVDTHLAVVFTYAALNCAFAVWMLQAYFASLPRDIEEAAWLEGCSRWRAIWRIFLPLAKPALAVTAMFTFINAWNEFAVIYTLIRSPENKTVTVQVVDLVAGRYSVNWHHVMAAALLASLPVALLFAWLQKYLVQGLAIGASK